MMRWLLPIGNFFYGLYFELASLGKAALYEFEIDGARFRLRKGTSDKHVVKEVWSWDSYVRKPSGVVVDIGANIGSFAVYAARSAERVCAFEPDPESCELLRYNLEQNSCRNVEVHSLAVAGTRSSRMLHSGGRNRSATSLCWRMTFQPGTEVNTITLDDVLELCELDRIDVLKIDVEGAEYEILMEAQSESLERIDLIEVEYHPVRGHSWRKLRCVLRNAGFEVERRWHWYTPFARIGNLRARRPAT